MIMQEIDGGEVAISARAIISSLVRVRAATAPCAILSAASHLQSSRALVLELS